MCDKYKDTSCRYPSPEIFQPVELWNECYRIEYSYQSGHYREEHVSTQIFNEYKIECWRNMFLLQKLIQNCMDLGLFKQLMKTKNCLFQRTSHYTSEYWIVEMPDLIWVLPAVLMRDVIAFVVRSWSCWFSTVRNADVGRLRGSTAPYHFKECFCHTTAL